MAWICDYMLIFLSIILLDTLGQPHKKELEKLKNKDCVPKTTAEVVQRSKSVVEKVQNKSGTLDFFNIL